MAKVKTIEAEVKALNARLASTEGTNRFMYRVQVKQLADAEKLRKLALALARSTIPLEFMNPNPRRIVVSFPALKNLEDFARRLEKFHSPPRGPKPPLLRKWDREFAAEKAKGRK